MVIFRTLNLLFVQDGFCPSPDKLCVLENVAMQSILDIFYLLVPLVLKPPEVLFLGSGRLPHLLQGSVDGKALQRLQGDSCAKPFLHFHSTLNIQRLDVLPQTLAIHLEIFKHGSCLFIFYFGRIFLLLQFLSPVVKLQENFLRECKDWIRGVTVMIMVMITMIMIRMMIVKMIMMMIIIIILSPGPRKSVAVQGLELLLGP